MNAQRHSILAALLLALATATAANAATHTAASCSLADVQAKVNAAADGDTILIPNGSAAWSGGISTTKQILIRAQNYTPTKGGNVARNVVITNNSPQPLFNFTSGNSYHCGVAGIKFLEGSQKTNFVRIQGSGTKVPLVSDCWFDIDERFGDQPDVGIFSCLALGGVIWNCRFDTPGVDFQGFPGSQGGSIYIQSPRAWNTPSTMGALDTNGTINLYFEDCSFFNCSGCPDIDDKGRAVFRHCDFNGTSGLTHGFTSNWGGRHFEYYDCKFSQTTPERNCNRYFWARAGTGIFTDCEVNNNVTPSAFGSNTLLDIGDNTNPTGYPQPRQPGWGHDGTNSVIDPIYIWNNTGSRAYTWSVWDHWANNVKLNREIYVNSGPKPGYSKFTYPHPARGGSTPPPPSAPSITSQPQSVTVTAGQTATFSVTATGSTPLAYQWQKNGSNIAGATSASYTTPATVLADSGATFRVVVSNSAGSATSNTVTLTVNSSSGAPPALPEGNNGIAAQFPGDASIQTHADVVFADDFESYTSPSQLTTKWNEAYHLSNTGIETGAANVYAGAKSLRFQVPIQTTETSNTVIKYVNPKLDVLFVRCYTKFDAGFLTYGSSHNGTGIQANYSGPGIPADGKNKFYVGLENSGPSSDPAPGTTHLYVYHPEQRDIWGDHFYPDGRVVPFDYLPGDYGPYFVPRPNFTPQRDRWYCIELMVKANTPGLRDGRIAYWIDGKLSADFLNIRLRDVDTLKIDKFFVGFHINGTITRVNTKWYDNVVAAKSYIGPRVSPSGPVAPSITTQPQAKTVTVGQTATFSVTATGTSPLAYQWQKNGSNISGATGASYTTPATTLADNGATFRVIASNSAGSVTSNAVTLTVNSLPNQAPVIQSSPTASPNPVTLPATTTVSVVASDPDSGPQALTYTWSKVSGPGTTNFSPNGTTGSASSTVTFSAAGSYVLRVTVSDGAASDIDTVAVSVNPAPPVNAAPLVDAGPNRTVTMPSGAALDGTVSDDGLPNPPAKVTVAWSKVSGPGTVSFASASSVDTTASFSAAGSYVLRLTASDSALSNSDTMTVTVNSEPPPPSPPIGEVIVDNKDANTSRTGTWSVSGGANPYAGESLYSSDGTFRWLPVLPEAGTYEVYAWWTYHANRSTNVPYSIRHATGTATVNVNQQNSSLGGKWNKLGTFSFNTTSAYVEVSGANGQACADAVRFVKVDAPPPPPPADVIVDNRDANTSRTGTWSVSGGANPYAADSLYSNSGGTFRWLPALPEAGTYEVYAWWTYHANRSSSVPYTVATASGTVTVNVNQRDSSLGGKWNKLGTFSFNSTGAYVEVSSFNGQACADAVKFVKVDSAPPPPPADVIVDNKNASTSRTGTWAASSGLQPYGGDSLYSNGGGTFRWAPALPAAGGYKVYAWWTYHKNRSTSVPYRIAHSSGVATVTVNQNDEALGGQWNLLGTFDLAATGAYVEVSSENGQACADAVRFVSDSGAASSAVFRRDEDGPEIAALDVSKLALKRLFSRPGKDACRLQAVLPLPEDFAPGGKSLTIGVGGLLVEMIFDAKGKARGANGTCTLKLKKGAWILTANLKNLDAADAWGEELLVEEQIHGESRAITVSVELDGVLYSAEREVRYTAKPGKTGVAK